MNLQQLKYLCAVVDSKFSISKASDRLYTSQPGISKQIQLFERELGVTLLERSGNRIIGLTQPGKEVYVIAQRMLSDSGNIKKIGEEFSSKNQGLLIVATTHIHARYTLPKIINKFRDLYPNVTVSLRQGNPAQIANWIISGEVDLAISAAGSEAHEELVLIPHSKIHRCILFLPKHPLEKTKSLTLEVLVKYPLITLDTNFAGGSSVKEVFEESGLKPNIVLRAADTDVIKTYVEIGHGVAVVPDTAFDPIRDSRIRHLDASHLFPPTPIFIQIRQGKYLRQYMEDFIAMVKEAKPQKTTGRIAL
jgi:LysR family cys regulon transcriptional activator